MSFFNTIGIKDPELSKAEKKTSAQDKAIMDYFTNNPYAIKTALELSDELGIMFTSVRRSVTGLIKKDKLKYCGQKMERFGMPNNLIGLKVEYGQQRLSL